MKAFFVSVPHSGEEFPKEATWLSELKEPVLMCDVDRYVDLFYRPVCEDLKIPFLMTPWHRYLVDQNRLPGDIDADSVVGSENPSGTFTTGLHWVKTTTGIQLMPSPISRELHLEIVKKYYEPFHASLRDQYAKLKELGASKVYHLDAHSMPSMGTNAHRDPGAKRPEVVVSDVDGTSCEQSYRDLVVASYKEAGFQVEVNWPYKGGRVTQTYGKPELGQHAIQVELSRALYMDEVTKQKKADLFDETKKKIEKAITLLVQSLSVQNQWG